MNRLAYETKSYGSGVKIVKVTSYSNCFFRKLNNEIGGTHALVWGPFEILAALWLNQTFLAFDPLCLQPLFERGTLPILGFRKTVNTIVRN